MDLNELRALAEVADLGSVKAAADSLGWARGTVRRRLDALEARIGKPLLTRDERGARLTHAGHEVAARARRLLSEADALLHAARQEPEPSGTLRIRAIVGMPPETHAQLGLLLRSQMPRMRVVMHLAEDPLEEPLSAFDVLVHFGPRAPGDEWVSVPVAQVTERLFASRGYLEHHSAPTCLDDLREHRLVAWAAPGESGDIWRTPQGGSIAVEPAITTPSIFHAMHHIAAGVGIGLVPDGGFPTAGVDPAEFVRLLPDAIGATREVRVSFRKALRHDPGVRAFWDLCSGLAIQAGVSIDG